MSFSKNFYWGSASAAAQVEGAWDEDGRTPSIWDVAPDGKIAHHETPHDADRMYHHYREDIANMKKIGLKAYRFSVSWSRVIPAEGTVNEKGIQFYSDLVDELLKAGIEPFITLFHWDLPLWVYKMGGWRCERTPQLFADYTRLLAERLGDRVSHWMTFNEPSVFIGTGYMRGGHAPFLQLDGNGICLETRGVLLAHGLAVQTLRKYAALPASVGFALTGGADTPWELTPEAIETARRYTFEDRPNVKGVIWWADTMVLGKAPAPLSEYLSAEDLAVICQPLDFYGFNIYHSNNFSDVGGVVNPHLYPGLPRTAMGWSITPEVLYWLPKFLYERYGLPLFVTENGMANGDFEMSDGCVHDPQRVEFIRGYLASLKRAVDEGIPVLGYMYWSILDNFEWAAGYDKRFGIIYVDYRTQKRILKDSALFYADVIRTNGENLPEGHILPQ